MGNIIHKDLTDAELHVPGYLGASDPGVVGAGIYWVDTTLGDGKWIIKVRNSTDTAWESPRIDEVIHTLTGKTVLANNDVLLLEDSAASYVHKKILVSDLLAQLDARYATASGSGMVKATSGDPAPGYLDAKIDDDSIVIVSNKMQLSTDVYENLKSRIAIKLMQPSNTMSWGGCIMADGTARLFGYAGYDGLGMTSYSYLPTAPSYDSSWDSSVYGTASKLYASYYNQYILTSTGYVLSTGESVSYGNLGTGSTTRSYIFNLVKTDSTHYLTNVVKLDVSSGGDNWYGTKYALTSTGKIYAWGYNSHGQCGQGNITDPQPYAKEVTCPDGYWIDVAATAGYAGTCFGLTSTGKVYSWGHNYCWQLGIGDTVSSNYKTTPQHITALTNIIKIGASGTYSSSQFGLALKSNGQLYAWGGNNYGQLCIGSTTNQASPVACTGLSNVEDFWIASCDYPSVAARLSTGALVTWGYNGYGQLADGSTTTRTTSVSTGATITSSDKVCWSRCGAGYASLYLLTGGTLYSAGNNAYGQLGVGDSTSRASFLPVLGLAKNTISDISTWGYSNASNLAVLDSSGNVYVTGFNNYGQCGCGDTSTKYILTKVIF